MTSHKIDGRVREKRNLNYLKTWIWKILLVFAIKSVILYENWDFGPKINKFSYRKCLEFFFLNFFHEYRNMIRPMKFLFLNTKSQIVTNYPQFTKKTVKFTQNYRYQRNIHHFPRLFSTSSSSAIEFDTKSKGCNWIFTFPNALAHSYCSY